MTSQIKTGLLLLLLTAMVLFLGMALGGRGGLIVALVVALAMNVGSYWFSDRIVLSMYKARQLLPHDAPMLHSMVEELAARAGIPKPKIFLIPQDTPNAFATGRNPAHGVVAVTQGILAMLSHEELKGVLAHEIGHIRNRDILIQTVAGVMASVIMFVASMARWAAIFGGGDEDRPNPLAAILLSIIAPLAAMLVQMAISRSREYLADKTGAELARNPLALASALAKLHEGSKRAPMRAGNEATAHMFIVNPFTASKALQLFSTHPPMEERVRRLRAMAAAR